MSTCMRSPQCPGYNHSLGIHETINVFPNRSDPLPATNSLWKSGSLVQLRLTLWRWTTQIPQATGNDDKVTIPTSTSDIPDSCPLVIKTQHLRMDISSKYILHHER